MIVINNIDSQRFTFNGVEYFKNFTPVVVGNKIRVLNTYDSSIELTDAPRLYSDFEVDGVVYASVSLLQTALLPILYTRNSLVGDFLSSDITDYTPATTPLSGTEKALIHDGIDFKEVAVSEFLGDLQSVTDNGNSTTNTIITPIVKLPKGSFNVEIFPVDLTANRKLEAPDKDGIIATMGDIPLNPITGTGTNGQVAFFNGATTQTGDNGLFWDNTNKRLGVGTNVPTNTFTMGQIPANSLQDSTATFLSSKENSSNALTLIVASNVNINDRAVFAGRRSRGTLSSPSAVLANDPITTFLSLAFDGTSVQASAALSFEAESNASLGNAPQRITFFTGTTGANRAMRMVIQSNGNIAIGAATAGARLDVRAQGALATDIVFRVRNSTDTANLLQVNGQGTLSLGLQSSAPTGIEGAIYYNSTDKKHYGFNGTTWNALY